MKSKSIIIKRGFKGMKVLIAEDEDSCAMALKLITEQAGYDAVMARDGNEAWSELQRDDAPRLVILDWMMAGMSGLEVCRKLRKTDGDGYTYVIFLSAKSDKEDVISALDTGADDYMVKPFNKGELLARLRVGERRLGLQTENSAGNIAKRLIEMGLN
jgi:sigma-B regulation protein RsbU (phosphoserine phosphatase)